MSEALHRMLDVEYGTQGDQRLRERLAAGAAVNGWKDGETPLHVATRRRRLSAIRILVEHGADIHLPDSHGKTSRVHAARRGFDELVELLASYGDDSRLTLADQMAIAMVDGDWQQAEQLLIRHPEIARTGNPGEDRLLADLAGRSAATPVKMLIQAGADVNRPGMDDGSPLHQAAWFGQPSNVQLLLDAGARQDRFDAVHHSTALGWAVHGSRYSGDAENRQSDYVAIVRQLLDAGAPLVDPSAFDRLAYLTRLRRVASPAVRQWLPTHLPQDS